MADLQLIDLPAGGVAAAELCLAARRPVSDPTQLRVTARRAGAIAAELRHAGNQLASAADVATWSGAAAESFRQRLRHSVPNIAATAERYDDYAQALFGYALAVASARPVLQALSSQLDDELALVPAAPAATPGLPAVGAADAATLLDPARADALRRASEARDQALLGLARRFAEAYNSWVGAVRTCVAGIRHADAADPTRDLHGWSAWEHRLGAIAHYVDPVLDFARHPSWQSASNALSWLGSNFTFIALATLALCPPVAAVCLTVAAVLSAAQLAVDAWRKWGEHEQVSMGALLMDGLGAVPVGRIAEGGKAVGDAARAGWRAETGTGRVGAASAAAATEARHSAGALGRDLIADPRQVYAPGLRDAPRDYYRSTSYGGSAALARRWRGPVVWDGPNAVLGLPQIDGGTSTPQVAWSERTPIRHTIDAAPARLERTTVDIAEDLRRAVEPRP